MRIKLMTSKITKTYWMYMLLILPINIMYSQNCKSTVEIISNNHAVSITVDKVFACTKNISIELEKGKHVLQLQERGTKWNMKSVLDTIIISDCDKKYTFNYESEFYSFSSTDFKPAEFRILSNQESFFNTTSFKILIGSAAILGGVAAYYKIQADKKYDEYLNSKNNSALDDVNRFDLYSGISFGLMQINFGYLIYKFLTE